MFRGPELIDLGQFSQVLPARHWSNGPNTPSERLPHQALPLATRNVIKESGRCPMPSIMCR